MAVFHLMNQLPQRFSKGSEGNDFLKRINPLAPTKWASRAFSDRRRTARACRLGRKRGQRFSTSGAEFGIGIFADGFTSDAQGGIYEMSHIAHQSGEGAESRPREESERHYLILSCGLNFREN